MKQKLLFSLLLVCFIESKAQFKISPYTKGLAAVKQGYLEIGAEMTPSEKVTVVSFFRLPLTNKEENLLVIDRNTSAWTYITSIRLRTDQTGSESGSSMKVTYFTGQAEWGHNVFKYYPTGTKTDENSSTKNSISGEIKISRLTGAPTLNASRGARQHNYQARIRYSSQYIAAKETGVVQPANPAGVVTTANMIIQPPSKIPTISPAIAFQNYRGSNDYSFTHALFYDMSGTKNQNNPTNNIHRMRYEFWVFYYPVIGGTPNFKVGFGPFVSLRTKGDDGLNKAEYGGQIAVKIGDLFQTFF